MSTGDRKDKHTHADVNAAGLVAVATAWSVFYLIIIVMAVSGQTLSRFVEFAARN